MKKLVSVLLSGLVAASVCQADVSLPALISDHMVLQKTAKVPLWGKAEPGEKVNVSLDGTQAETVAGENGKWKVTLDLSQKGQGPYELVVQGKNRIVISDVVIGEVWICSGQSNMQLRLFHSLGAQEEIAASTNPLLREFNVEQTPSAVPLDDCKGSWKVSEPKTSQNFSGVAYYFGKTVQQQLKVPVGLITAAWGGSFVQAWMSKEILEADPDLKAGATGVWERLESFPAKEKEYFAKYGEWEKQYGRQDHEIDAKLAAPDVVTTDWKTIKLPGDFSSQGLSDNGAIWLRRTVPVTAQTASENYMVLSLGKVNGFFEVYWDGVKLLATSPDKDYPKAKALARINQPNLLKMGDHTLAVRVFTPFGKGEISGPPTGMNASPANIPLAGDWLAKEDFALPSLDKAAAAALPALPRQPPAIHHSASQLFNGMINPLIPYAIRGVAWYQGESNAGQARQYQTAFPAMISDWRAKWGGGDFGFYFCQLANYSSKVEQPGDAAWAEQREAQSKALALPATGQAILIDTGTANDIHPRDRKNQGTRLGLSALEGTYGQKIAGTSPTFDSMKIEGDKAIVKFRHAEGLVAKPLPADEILRYRGDGTPETVPLKLPSPGPVQGFAICGEDKLWKWAEGRIEGDTVVVSSPEVPHPVAVRYAWADNPTCNLYSGAGLPAAPFRTDEFPGISNGRYFFNDYP